MLYEQQQKPQVSGAGGGLGLTHLQTHTTVILKVMTFQTNFVISLPSFQIICQQLLQNLHQRQTEGDSGNYSNRVQTPTVMCLRFYVRH